MIHCQVIYAERGMHAHELHVCLFAILLLFAVLFLVKDRCCHRITVQYDNFVLLRRQKLHADQASDTLGTLTHRINQLKRQIQTERVVAVRVISILLSSHYLCLTTLMTNFASYKSFYWNRDLFAPIFIFV